MLCLAVSWWCRCNGPCDGPPVGQLQWDLLLWLLRAFIPSFHFIWGAISGAVSLAHTVWIYALRQPSELQRIDYNTTSVKIYDRQGSASETVTRKIGTACQHVSLLEFRVWGLQPQPFVSAQPSTFFSSSPALLQLSHGQM